MLLTVVSNVTIHRVVGMNNTGRKRKRQCNDVYAARRYSETCRRPLDCTVADRIGYG
jgi:hypothetical protein